MEVTSHILNYSFRVLPHQFGIRFSCVTSRIPDPDQLTHSGRILGCNSRISDPVCGGWLTDSVGGQWVEVGSSRKDFGGIWEVRAVFGRQKMGTAGVRCPAEFFRG